MTFRTVSDIVRAHNEARDLTNLVRAYLTFWRKHANGRRNINIESSEFAIIIRPMESDDQLRIGIYYTKTVTYEEPTYYDVDDDNYVESYSRYANVSGSTFRHKDVQCDCYINIPVSCLLRSEKDMEQNIIDFVAKDIAREKEEARLAEIKRLETKLQELRQV